ncbi:MAG: hypothetical protein AAGG68_04710 [Bacteroidota bacterium]
MLDKKQLTKAVKVNKKYSDEIGWDKHLVERLIFKKNKFLSWESFSVETEKWQAKNGFSTRNCDGIIGIITFGAMLDESPKFQNLTYNNFIEKIRTLLLEVPDLKEPLIIKSLKFFDKAVLPIDFISLISDMEKVFPSKKLLVAPSKLVNQAKTQAIFLLADKMNFMSTVKSNIPMWNNLLHKMKLGGDLINYVSIGSSTIQIAYELKTNKWNAHTGVSMLSVVGGIGTSILTFSNPVGWTAIILWAASAVSFSYAMYDIKGKQSEDLNEYLGRDSRFGNMLRDFFVSEQSIVNDSYKTKSFNIH